MSINYIINFYIAKILPLISFLLFIYQLFCNYYFYSNIDTLKNNNIHLITRYIYIIFYLMALFSFIMTYITEPGYVTQENNQQYIYLYQKTRKYSLNRAEIYNQNHINNSKNQEDDDDDNYDLFTDGLSSDDEKIFKESNDQKKFYINCKKYKNLLNFDVKQCRQCFIIKVCGTMHCSVCHKCVYMKDHHCIWFNQCIGQFNLKYYILFLLYLLLCSYISLIKNLYYIICKNYIKIITEYSFIKKISLFSFNIFDIIYVIISIKLLYDQYTNLDDFSIMYDYKRKKIIEIRTKYEMLCEDFGGKFGIAWFFPFKAGGYYELIKKEKYFNTGINGNKIKKN